MRTLGQAILIRALMKAAGDTPSPAASDLLRAICAAIDVPLPEILDLAAN